MTNPKMRFWLINPEDRTIRELGDGECCNLTAIADSMCADRMVVQRINTDQGDIYYAPEPRCDDSFIIDGIHFPGLSVIASLTKPRLDFV